MSWSRANYTLQINNLNKNNCLRDKKYFYSLIRVIKLIDLAIICYFPFML